MANVQEDYAESDMRAIEKLLEKPESFQMLEKLKEM